MNRRSFFNRIARAAAIVALAPQIAFRTKPIEFVEAEISYRANSIGIRDQLRMCDDILADAPLDINAMMAQCYAINKQRDKQAHIEWITDEKGVAWIEREARREFLEDFFFK